MRQSGVIAVFLAVSAAGTGQMRTWDVVRGPEAVWRRLPSAVTCTAQAPGDYRVLSNAPLHGDWILRADLKLSAAPSQGLLFAMQDTGAGYLLSIGDAVAIRQLSKGESKPVAEWPRPGGRGSQLALKVMKTGATYAFWIDGKLVNTISNPAWPRDGKGGFTAAEEPESGRFGFAFAAAGTASNVRVESIELARKFAGNPVLDPGPKGSWDESQAFTAGVRQDGSEFHLYYTGIDATDPKQEGGGYGRLGAATSTDLIHWTKYEKNPLLGPGAAGDWDSHHLQFGPVTLAPDGRYAVTYQGWDDPHKSWIGMGVAFGPSPLGPFEKWRENPVLRTSSDPLAFDHNHIHLHTVVRRPSGEYVMLYTGNSALYHGKPGDRGGMATSTDLIHWRKYPGNPVFDLGEPGAWDDGHVRPKGVAFLNGWYYMFYEGAHMGNKVWFDQVGMARSRDLMHWERFPRNPIIPLDTAPAFARLVTEWPCPLVRDGELDVLYWSGNPERFGISLARVPKTVLEGWRE